ncbi:hypothetical protein BJX65DRAFT_279380 [Aspergillus insuetus]
MDASWRSLLRSSLSQRRNFCRRRRRRPQYHIPRQVRRVGPLSGFLQRFRGLNDLFWLSDSQFPPCLREVLHRDLPSCRLHMRGFKFDSLYSQTQEPCAIDIHESALATSPSLTSVVCRIRGEGIVSCTIRLRLCRWPQALLQT